MANFPVDPIPFIPRGGVLLYGGGVLRRCCNVVSLSGQQINKHEDMAIAIYEEHFDALERQEFLQLIHHHITQVLRLQEVPKIGPNGKEPSLPAEPTIQDFAEVASADQVTVDKLMTESQVDTHLVPVTHHHDADNEAA
ncbi:hypothetical protein GUJ93_ZPchr0001g31990 [Zizania palustris]|uniref:DUF7597 domain-containing protein n=1 Tax=Zizania palustris TaxID=103762 RepID=A0A8J5S9B6_ZIZPA|nr:hypothetical protein GUJ93_ZPchr0001g31990 [Zizania palustris]